MQIKNVVQHGDRHKIYLCSKTEKRRIPFGWNPPCLVKGNHRNSGGTAVGDAPCLINTICLVKVFQHIVNERFVQFGARTIVVLDFSVCPFDSGLHLFYLLVI